MQVVKYVLYVLGGLVLLFLIVALFLPSHFTVERSITINASDSLVYATTLDFNSRQSWDPWIEMEPDAQVAVTGTPGSIGSGWNWQGEKIGSGKLTVVHLESNRLIKSDIYFDMDSEPAAVTWRFEPSASGTTVYWRIEGDLGYPVERYFGLMMDSMVGEGFEKGLSNLKKVVGSPVSM